MNNLTERIIFSILICYLMLGCEKLLNDDDSDQLPKPAGKFIPDFGFRIENGSNPAPFADKDGAIYLFYSDNRYQPPKRFMTTSTDGLNFDNPTEVLDRSRNPFNKLMPDGKTWRHYQLNWKPDRSEYWINSESSTDGINFKKDEGIRYVPAESDSGTLGVFDILVVNNAVWLLYVGAIGYSTSNVRLAESNDNGLSFQFLLPNVFNDSQKGLGYDHRDPRSHILENGIRVYTMVQGLKAPHPGHRAVGNIYSFLLNNTNDFIQEDGIRLSHLDFTDYNVWSLNDPWVVTMKNGTHRMYVASLIGIDSSDVHWSIISAAWDPNK